MYNVTPAYITKMLDEVQTHKLSGTIDGIPFSDTDVIGVNYSNKCADKKVQLGSVYIGVLKLTFLTDLLNRGTYRDKKIVLTDSLLTGYDENEDPIWESVPIGEFYVAEALWTAAGVDVTAYDVMSKLDNNLNVDQTASTIFGFCNYIAEETNTVFGMTEEECEALPNGTEIISPYEENNIQTFRDLLSAIAQMIGGFATANRDGSWKIRPFENVSVISIPKNRRASGTSFSDYETYYDTVQYTDLATDTVRYIGDNEGLAMQLDAQPFLQYGTYEATYRRTMNIVDSIKRMKYTPFKAKMLPAFIALDLGDVVDLTDDYSGGDSSGCVMMMTFSYNKAVDIQCFGDNPNLRSAQSKADKNISGLLQNTVQNEVTYYNFENLDRIRFGSDVETTIANLYFTAAQTTTVKILHEFVMDMIKDLMIDGSYELRYYYDGQLVNYHPYEALSGLNITTQIPNPDPEESGSGTIEPIRADIEPVDLTITRDFFYILRNVAPNIRHSWQVRIIAHGIDEVTIEPNHAHITLEGQRLYGDEYFDGYIDVLDEVGLVQIGGLDLVSVSDSADLNTQTNEALQAADNVTLIDVGALGVLPISEGTGALAPHIYLDGALFIATEDDLILCTEDDVRILIE